MATLNVALIGGPAYDALYARLPEFERQSGRRVRVCAQLPHPQLNARLAADYAGDAGGYDLVSTHTKYAPSQAHWLLPLDEWINEGEQAAFFPGIVELCRINIGAGDRLFQLPRNVDVRLLHYRSDLFDAAGVAPPANWDDFRERARQFTRAPGFYGTTFPGRHSGLFGTWYELVAMAGGRLFDDDLQPAFLGEAGEWALAFLHALHTVDRSTPRDLPSGHYEEVAALFRSGACAMILEWPGYYGLLKDPARSAVAGRFAQERYPPGPAGIRRVYAGSHSFAIPRDARDIGASLELLRFLASEESQTLEGMAGSIVPRRAAWERVKRAQAADPLDARRMELLEITLREDMLMPPRLPQYPAVEGALWTALQAGVTGELAVREALRRAHVGIEALRAVKL